MICATVAASVTHCDAAPRGRIPPRLQLFRKQTRPVGLLAIPVPQSISSHGYFENIVLVWADPPRLAVDWYRGCSSTTSPPAQLSTEVSPSVSIPSTKLIHWDLGKVFPLVFQMAI